MHSNELYKLLAAILLLVLMSGDPHLDLPNEKDTQQVREIKMSAVITQAPDWRQPVAVGNTYIVPRS